MTNRIIPLLLCLLAFAAGCGADYPSAAQPHSRATTQVDHGLPPEAIETLARIRRGGPFPYRKDGAVFHNREKRLPQQMRGFYREYTVPTPGADTRGARRIVAGGQPPDVFYYTADHYRSFKRIPDSVR